jgi:hypothetical protein
MKVTPEETTPTTAGQAEIDDEVDYDEICPDCIRTYCGIYRYGICHRADEEEW